MDPSLVETSASRKGGGKCRQWLINIGNALQKGVSTINHSERKVAQRREQRKSRGPSSIDKGIKYTSRKRWGRASRRYQDENGNVNQAGDKIVCFRGGITMMNDDRS